MKFFKSYLILGAIFFCHSLSYSQMVCGEDNVIYGSTVPCNSEPFVLVFEDNFDGNQLDLNNWQVLEGVNSDFSFGKRKAWYQKENVKVSNGTLKIIAERFNPPYVGTYKDGDDNWKTKTSTFLYSSAELISKNKFLEGKFEIRCKIPKGKGFWPAFWTFGGPEWNEIDVFEFWNEESLAGVHVPPSAPQAIYDPGLLSRVANFTTHGHYYTPDAHHYCGSDYVGVDYSQDFHTFTMVWDYYRISWYIDGVLRHSTTRFRTILEQQIDCNAVNPYTPYLESMSFPHVSTPLNMLATLAIQSGPYNSPNATTPFPSAFEIDYIRYFSREKCVDYISAQKKVDLNMQQDLYNAVVAKTIDVGSNVTILDKEQLKLIAKDEIILDPGFMAELGSSFIAQIDESICPDKPEGSNLSDVNDESSVVNKSDIELFPNPVDDILNIDLSSANIQGEYELGIFDMVGKRVYHLLNLDKKVLRVDMSDFDSGSYILEIKDLKTNQKHIKRILKKQLN